MTREEAYLEYKEAVQEDPDGYSSFGDYLGANAKGICDSCDMVCEYDEFDEDGMCFDCSSSYEDEDEDE